MGTSVAICLLSYDIRCYIKMISSFTFSVCKYIRSQISEQVVILEDTTLNACVLGIPPLSLDYHLWWFRCPIFTKSWADDLEDIGQDQKLLYIKHLIFVVNISTKCVNDISSERTVMERTRFCLQADGRTDGKLKPVYQTSTSLSAV